MYKSNIKKVHFVFGNPYDFIGKASSAVGEYLAVIEEVLEKNKLKVQYYGKEDATPPASMSTPSSTQGLGRKLKLTLKNNLPYVYNSLVDYKYFRAQEHLKQEVLQLESSDVVVEFLIYGSNIGLEVSKRFKSDLIVIYDSPQLEQYEEIHKALSSYSSTVKRRETETLQYAKAILCYSDSVKNFIVRTHDLDPSIIKVFPCINWNKLSERKAIKPSSNLVTIGFIGSFLPWHKVHLLVQAFDNLYKQYKNIKLVLIGKGIEWEQIKQLVATLDSKAHIEMTGFLDDDEFLKKKLEFDIGVVPCSNWYGSPLKIFEYGALKLPVVAPNVPTVVDTFEKDKEILILDQSNEQVSLEQNLERLILDPDLREELGEKIYHKINTDYTIEKFQDLWKEMIFNLS